VEVRREMTDDVDDMTTTVVTKCSHCGHEIDVIIDGAKIEKIAKVTVNADHNMNVTISNPKEMTEPQ